MRSVTVPANEAQARAAIYDFLAGVLSSRPTQGNVSRVCQMAGELGVGCSDNFSLSDLNRESL